MDRIEKVTALPVQCMEVRGGVLLKRGTREIVIMAEAAATAVSHILTLTTGREAMVEEICEAFPLPRRDTVRKLIDRLVEARILLPSSDQGSRTEHCETHLDIFYWEFNATAQEALNLLIGREIAVLGVNHISRQLVAALHTSGLESVRVIDVPLLRNIQLFDLQGRLVRRQWSDVLPVSYQSWLESTTLKDVTCLVATSDFGVSPVLSQLNQFCVEGNIHFLPVVLHNLNGYIGPLVIPKETACYECLRSRENSHFLDSARHRASEDTAFTGQRYIGFHPLMASILADFAAFELTRFYSGLLPQPNMGKLIELDLLSSRLVSRKVLKAPRCSICSPLNSSAAIETEKDS